MSYTQTTIDWQNIRGVIFDMDGTLYRQFPVRFWMSLKLITNALIANNGWRDLQIVLHYRKNREKLAEDRIENISAIEFSATAKEFLLSEKEVAEIIHRWMDIKPLKYISGAKFCGVDSFFAMLAKKEIKIGVFSDYPVAKKLEALGLSAQAICYSSEPDVNRLKPRPEGLLKTIERLGLDKSNCVMIGDRVECDGVCAHEAGVAFLLCNNPQFYNNLLKVVT